MSPTLRLRMSTMRGVSYSNKKARSTEQQPAMALSPALRGEHLGVASSQLGPGRSPAQQLGQARRGARKWAVRGLRCSSPPPWPPEGDTPTDDPLKGLEFEEQEWLCPQG